MHWRQAPLVWAALSGSCAAAAPPARRPSLHAAWPRAVRPVAMFDKPKALQAMDGGGELSRNGGLRSLASGGSDGGDSNSGSEGERRVLLSDEGGSASPRPWRESALLPMLLAVYLHNQWSRSLLFYLVDFGPREQAAGESAARELMNVELGFGAETYGVLASLPFTLMFAPLSLLAGGAADASDRARLTWASLLVWSAATFWQGSAHSPEQVAASRALQGMAQAFTTPAAFTLLADVTPPGRRGTANSIYSTGVYVGGGLAALSILIDKALGWRGTLHSAALLGALLAAAAAFVLEDTRQLPGAQRPAVPLAASDQSPSDPSSPAPVGSAVGLLVGARALAVSQAASLGRTAAAVAQRPAVQLLLASCALRFCAGFSIAVWVGPWGREAFPEREADFALAKALISAFGGGFSAIAGGALSDKLGERDAARRLWLPIAGSLGAAVCWSAMLDAHTFEWAMAWLLMQYLFAECWFGAAVATLQAQLPKEVQGGAQGVFSTLTVVGNISPLLIGQASKVMPLVDVLHQAVPGLYVASAVAFALTCRQFGPPPKLNEGSAE